MNHIKLLSKKTGKVHNCDVYLSNVPQMIAIEVDDGEAYSYPSFAAILKDWEVVGED